MYKMYNEIIKELREDNDKTQAQIANILKIDQSYYSKYEKGIRQIPINHIITLCNYYEISADYILGIPYSYKRPQR